MLKNKRRKRPKGLENARWKSWGSANISQFVETRECIILAHACNENGVISLWEIEMHIFPARHKISSSRNVPSGKFWCCDKLITGTSKISGSIKLFYSYMKDGYRIQIHPIFYNIVTTCQPWTPTLLIAIKSMSKCKWQMYVFLSVLWFFEVPHLREASITGEANKSITGSYTWLLGIM